MLSGGAEDRGGWGRGRNDEYENDEYNDKDRIHVRRNFVNVGGVGKGLGTTGMGQQQRLPNENYKDKDKD